MKIKFGINSNKGKRRNLANVAKEDTKVKLEENLTIQKTNNIRRTAKVGEIVESKESSYRKRNLKNKYKRKGASSSYTLYRIKQYMANLFKNKQKITVNYYILLAGMVLLGGTSLLITIKAYNKFSTQDYNTYASSEVSTSIDSGAVVSEDDTGKNDNSNPNDTQAVQATISTDSTKTAEDTNYKAENKTNSTTNSNTTTKKVAKAVVQPLTFQKPVPGKIIKEYSPDKVIYSKTLELWKTNNGVNFEASIDSEVKSAERGTVEKIYEDSFYGITILIDHGQGYKSMYANLEKEVLCKEKQTIKKGDVIAKIGNTSIGEIKDDPHLHFELFKDGKNIDPMSKLT